MKYYITTAISYPNGSPHIGHAYEAILADCLARYHRLCGDEVLFQTGTDEHGLKIAQTAERAGVSPQQFVDTKAAEFRAMDDALAISYDRFIRTTDPDHHEACQALWNKLRLAGDIYLGKYEGWYCVREERWCDEKEICDGKTPDGYHVEWTVEETYFFRLSKYRNQLRAHFEDNPSFLQPESARNEIMNLLEGELNDLCVSRSAFTWGIPVPDSDHVMYVWVDALTNYLTGAGFPHVQDYWPADLHVVGKDITRFHAIYWPAFLMSAELPLPKQILAHGFLLSDGKKMAKSEGNVVEPLSEINQFGVDAVRYYLLRSFTVGRDGDYRRDNLVTMANADLANTIGNLAQRTLSLIHSYYEQSIPAPQAKTEEDIGLFHQSNVFMADYHGFMRDNDVDKAATVLLQWANILNKYLQDEKPWLARKVDYERGGAILYNVAEQLRRLAISLQPFVPEGAAKLLQQLGQTSVNFIDMVVDLVPKTSILKPEPIFPRIELAVPDGTITCDEPLLLS